MSEMSTAVQRKKKQNRIVETFRRMFKNKVSLVGFIIIVVIILACILAPLLAPYNPSYMDYGAVKCTPNAQHILGCDSLGRDIFSRLLYGGRYSLSLGFICAVVGMLLGLFFGCLIGFIGGTCDLVVMRICDVASAIPGMLLAILISAALGSGFFNTILAMTIGGIPGSIRASRAMSLKEREMEYLEAAKAMNASKFKMIFKHMMPNVVSPTIVSTTMMIGNTIMAASGLSFIGLGIQPPTPEWGAMLSDASNYLLTDPHMILGPGLAILVTVLAINMIGDGLRDALDPKLKDADFVAKEDKKSDFSDNSLDSSIDENAFLKVKNLFVEYKGKSTVHAVNGITFSLKRGKTIGLVGETGAGKTTIAKSILRVLPDPPAKVTHGEIILDGENLLEKPEKEMLKIRGAKVAMIFQDPMTALNPLMSVGSQIKEVIELHNDCSKVSSEEQTMRMLEMVGIPRERFPEYPHQFSGGMQQRVVIAMALACQPELLLADEPTTALDVTIQAQVLEMINDLKNKMDSSMILITHDLGVVAQTCDEIAVIYAGQIVEKGTKEEIYLNPKHPYTLGLFNSIPNLEDDAERLSPIKGLPPDPTNLPSGCAFAERCTGACEACRKGNIPAADIGNGHFVRCIKCGEVE